MTVRVPFTGGEKESAFTPASTGRAEPLETTADIVAYHGRARAAADSVIEESGIEDVGTAWFGDTVTVRWVLIHMIEETARHVGHMASLRELVDGRTGAYPDG